MKQAILSHENGSRFDISMSVIQPQPDSIRFTGNVYVLINHLSFSNSTSVAGIIKDHRLGELIGEETPDFVSGYGASQHFILPNTQIAVTFPKAKGGDAAPHSVKPDYKVEDNTSDGKDEILEYTLDLIKKEIQ
jgi:C-terminal processing protease CtpA/Prc